MEFSSGTVGLRNVSPFFGESVDHAEEFSRISLGF
jgi:hypothetical protein